MTLTHKELVEVLKYLEDSSCEEFSLQMEGVDLLLRRQVAGSAAAPRPEPRSRKRREESKVEKAQAESKAAPKPSAPAPEPAAASAAGQEVLAPMSGTFYRRPAPDADPFVEVGSEVREGDPLCMIEVMKLFSTVYAETAGRVTAIGSNDGDAVEKGQVLVVIEPAAG